MYLTAEQVVTAFDLISKNKKTVNTYSANKALESYLPNVPNKVKKITKREKEEVMSLKTLLSLYRDDFNHLQPNWYDIFQMFESKNRTMQKETLIHIIKRLNPHGMLRKGDLQVVMKALDVNGDGLITYDDLEKARYT